MAERQSAADRQRRIGAYLFLGVGLINLVVGVVAGAGITIVVSIVMLVVGVVLLASSLTGAGGAPD
jgi:hypothetical protein